MEDTFLARIVAFPKYDLNHSKTHLKTLPMGEKVRAPLLLPAIYGIFLSESPSYRSSYST